MKAFMVVPAALAATLVLSSGCGTPHLKLHTSYVYDTAITVKTPPVVRPNPFTDTRVGNQLYDEVVFQTLLSLDPNGRLAPGLAKSWSRNPSGTIWHLTLNPYAKWWSGRPVTAQNVVWTLDLYRNPASGFVNARKLANVERIDISSKTTVTIILKRPDRNFAANALTPQGGLWILPSFLLQRDPASRVRTSRYLTDMKDLVGTGPYRPFKSTSNTLTWVAYPRYFGGPPKTKYLRWVWGNDLAQSVDIAQTSTHSSHYGTGYRTISETGTHLWYLASPNAFLSSVVKAATNVQALPGVPAHSPQWAPAPLKPPRQRSASLQTVMSHHGYHRVQGLWVGPGGSRVSLLLTAPRTPFGRDLARALKSQWTAQGLHVRFVDSSQVANVRLAFHQAHPHAEFSLASRDLLVWSPVHWHVAQQITDFVPNVWQPFYKAEGWRVRSGRKPVTQ